MSTFSALQNRKAGLTPSRFTPFENRAIKELKSVGRNVWRSGRRSSRFSTHPLTSGKMQRHIAMTPLILWMMCAVQERRRSWSPPIAWPRLLRYGSIGRPLRIGLVRRWGADRGFPRKWRVSLNAAALDSSKLTAVRENKILRADRKTGTVLWVG